MQLYKLNSPQKPSLFLTPSSQISLPPKPHLHDPPISQPARPNPTSDDTELSIFNAERYFNEVDEPMELSRKLPPITKRPHLSPLNSQNPSFQTTPTSSSEASWNSQIGLLKNPPGSLTLTVKNFPLSEQRKSSANCNLFRRTCPCSGKKSVEVEHTSTDPKSPTQSKNQNFIKVTQPEPENPTKLQFFHKENQNFHFSPDITRRGFSFPVLAEAMEDARNSLEVFQPNLRKSVDFERNLERKISFNIPSIPKLRCPIDDDLASDASSDLFEIESLSTQINNCRNYCIDEFTFEKKKIAGNLPIQRSIEEELYPPSEVSVSWSVNTADGFDWTSVANFSTGMSEVEVNRFEPVAGEGRKGISVGGLLSCRSEKAVCVVAPKMVRVGPDVQRRIGVGVEPDLVLGCARFGAGNPVRDGAALLGSRSVRMNGVVQPVNTRAY